MQKFLSFCLILALALSLVACSGGQASETTAPNASAQPGEKTEGGAAADANAKADVAPGYVASAEPTNYVDIRMDSGAHIVIQLNPDVAPKTVENFKKLVNAGFYNGLGFHRVIDGFMIQGGDPKGDGTGGAEDKIVGEFEANGHKNSLKHVRGTVSMARAQDPNSASSQFFICNGDAPYLDGQYAAFGTCVLGMEEVDRIAKLPKDANDRPDKMPIMEKVQFVKPAA